MSTARFTDLFTQIAMDRIFNRLDVTGQNSPLELGLLSVPAGSIPSKSFEITGGGYARQDISGGSVFSAASSGASSNASAIVFGPATEDWASVTHLGIFDTDDDKLLMAAELDAAGTVANGDTAEFAIGAIDLTAGTGVLSAAYADELVDLLVGELDGALADQPLYLSLHSEDPTAAGTAGELTAASYARLAFAGSTSHQTDIQTRISREGYNPLEILWPAAGEAWGTVTHVGVWDAASGGNFMMRAELAAPVSISSGHKVRIPASGFLINLK